MVSPPIIPVPEVTGQESFDLLVQIFARYLIKVVDKPVTFDEFRKSHSQTLAPLSKYLIAEVHHPALIVALMALCGQFAATEDDDDEGVNAARASACEVLALRYTSHLSEREAMDSLLYELPTPGQTSESDMSNGPAMRSVEEAEHEQSPLLGANSRKNRSRARNNTQYDGAESLIPQTTPPEAILADSLQGLNALEVAAVSQAKKFLSQRPIQRIITSLWNGDIVLWSTLSQDAVKHAHIYRKHTADPYSRLRVPKYLKAFEVLFFLGLLILYYVVLVQRDFGRMTVAEILMYVWLGSFALQECSEILDAGAFYLSDVWSGFDISIILIGLASFLCRVIGLSNENRKMIDTSFDLLSCMALILVPRLCSLLSLHPYFGTLLPCLKAMSIDFVKFLSLVVILYLGWLTTFSLLARGLFSFSQMSGILIRVFFGSSYLGLDVAQQISPILGPPLMFVFVCITQMLLITSLISLLSNSLSKVIQHARDEYLFVYSVFVLEASTSNRLTYFIPPLNLIPLVLRPLRLFVAADRLRGIRIALLRVTHFPHVCAITAYEDVQRRISRRNVSGLPMAATAPMTPEPPSRRKRFSRSNRLSTPQPLAISSFSRNIVDSQTSDSERVPSPQIPDRQESLDELKTAIARLSSQVEALTARLADQDIQPAKAQST